MAISCSGAMIIGCRHEMMAFIQNIRVDNNLPPTFRSVYFGVEGFAHLHCAPPRPSGRGGARSALKAGVLNRIGLRIKHGLIICIFFQFLSKCRTFPIFFKINQAHDNAFFNRTIEG
jgi:hypothetical protein